MNPVNEKNNNIKSSEQEKEQLLKELSENLVVELGETATTDKTPNQNTPKGPKIGMSTIPEASIEISCIEPSRGMMNRMEKNEDCTILNIFGDDDDNLVSFYGAGGDLENLVKNIDLKKNEPTGYLPIVNYNKISNEQLSKLTQSIEKDDLLACKKYIDKMEFDGKMVTKVNDLKSLLMKSKEIANEDMDEILNNKEYSKELFAWRDILPGEESFYRAIMFSYIEYLILNKDLDSYRTFLYNLSMNISDNFFLKILENYQIDITKVKISLALIYYALNAGSSDSYVIKAIKLFMKTYNMDMNFDLLLILNLKYNVYKYLKLNENKLYSKKKAIKIGEFLPENFTKNGKYNYKEFYENNLLQLGKEADKIVFLLIPFIFKRDLYIYHFEKKKIHYDYYNAESKENKESFPFRIVNLNGSYDIIYEKDYYSTYEQIFTVYSNVRKNSLNNTKKENETKNEGVIKSKPTTNENNNSNQKYNNNNNNQEQNPNSLKNQNNNKNNINPNNQALRNFKKLNTQNIDENKLKNKYNAINNLNQNNQNNQIMNNSINNINLNNDKKIINNGGIPDVFRDMNKNNNNNII